MNYHVSDFIIKIKNASMAHRPEVHMTYSKLILAIGKVLVKEGYLAGVKEEEVDGKKGIVATVRYVRRKPVLHNVTIVSKPSLRVYVPTTGLKTPQKRSMTSILSTSSGVMTGREAEKKGVGGELLFEIW
jgi:small subunit ribosomal protein S8